jgi:outer membrane lipoprotein LolB
MHRVLIVAVAIGLLASCATTPQLPVTYESHEQWQQRQLNLKDLDHWSIRGRVAVFSRDDVYNLGLGWKRQGTVSQVKLEATLGQGVIQLNKSDHSVELTTSEGDRYEGDNAQQVLLNSTGLMIPVEGLESWIKGIPHDNSYFLPDIDYLGRAKSIKQDGWTINYLDYEQVELGTRDHPDLPRKIYMKHDGLALKIVIDQWQSKVVRLDDDIFPQFPDRP